MKAIIKRYLAYNHWANHQYISSIIGDQIEDEKAHWQMSHILNAQQVWQQRLKREPLKFKVFQIHPSNEWQAIETELYHEALTLLERLNLDDTIHYESTSGKSYQDKVADIFMHFIDHSSYHRGQLAISYREVGKEPLKTNFIHWSRTSN